MSLPEVSAQKMNAIKYGKPDGTKLPVVACWQPSCFIVRVEFFRPQSEMACPGFSFRLPTLLVLTLLFPRDYFVLVLQTFETI